MKITINKIKSIMRLYNRKIDRRFKEKMIPMKIEKKLMAIIVHTLVSREAWDEKTKSYRFNMKKLRHWYILFNTASLVLSHEVILIAHVMFASTFLLIELTVVCLLTIYKVPVNFFVRVYHKILK